jgi:predicted Rossmann fold nucleotide-binding protein DprA/Smf involved in DNA uptake
MKTLNQLMQDIIQLTTEIETKYPELYKYLNETPLTLYKNGSEKVHTTELQGYLETLKSLLQHHIETHHNNK